jgi:hypothetical protein
MAGIANMLAKMIGGRVHQLPQNSLEGRFKSGTQNGIHKILQDSAPANAAGIQRRSTRRGDYGTPI